MASHVQANRIVFGIPDPPHRVVGLPEDCIGAVIAFQCEGDGKIRCEFADRFEDYFLIDNGDGTMSPVLAPDAGPIGTIQRVAGEGGIDKLQVPLFFPDEDD